VRLQSAQIPLRKSVRPRNLSNLSRSLGRCQPAALTGFPPVFNSRESSCGDGALPRTYYKLFFSAPENAFHPAHAETEVHSKIKDRLEALLFAETLQGTLSPNANPGKGSIGGFTEFDAKSHCDDSAGGLDTHSLVLDSICYTKPPAITQGLK